MYAFVLFWIVFVIQIRTTEGQHGCDHYETVVTEIGGIATFFYKTLPNITFWSSSYLYHGSERISQIYHYSSDFNIGILFYNSYRNRTNVSWYIDPSRPYPGNLTITLHNIVLADNGTYEWSTLGTRRTHHCWILYITRVQLTPFTSGQEISSSEEGYPMSLTSSGSVPEGLDFTSTWLIDGSIISSGALYLIIEQDMWILRTDRIMNDRNITCMATYENGLILEENYTLHLTYGPDPNLIFNPDKSIFIADVGGPIPDITCTAVCSPPCEITWTSELTQHDTTDAHLRLGTATVAKTENIIVRQQELEH